MRYELKINAYDVMDQVVVITSLWADSQMDDVRHEVLLTRHLTFGGVGRESPGDWLCDVLVALIESL
jgi:hypothetical protein